MTERNGAIPFDPLNLIPLMRAEGGETAASPGDWRGPSPVVMPIILALKPKEQ